MYKSTQDALSFLWRVASHSTKGTAGGKTDYEQNAIFIFNSIAEQHELVKEQLHKTREDIQWIKRKLTQHQPKEESDRLHQEHERLAEQMQMLERLSAKFNSIRRDAAREAWGQTFREVARNYLDKETFERIRDETDSISGIDRNELFPKKDSRSNLLPEKKRQLNATDHRRKKERKKSQCEALGQKMRKPSQHGHNKKWTQDAAGKWIKRE